jgi:ribosomal protein S18 acetylase RimI-like enzyme
MIAPPSPSAANLNLIYTYLELGSSIAGGKAWREPGFCACTGPLDHPVCNFATDLALDRISAAKLAEVARTRRTFAVYSLPGDSQEQNDLLLREFGFDVTHRLIQLQAEVSNGDAQSDLREAVATEDRRRVATFMAEQFFAKHAHRYRRGIVEATQSATPLRLFRKEIQGRVEAAVMLSEHLSTIGIYNLCVDTSLRRQGLGTEIVRDITHQALSLGLGVSLQCERNLVGWYRRIGFKDLGEVTVYGLCRVRDVAIMGA